MTPISDLNWRRFLDLKARALDRYVETTLERVTDLVHATDRTPLERYRALWYCLEERDVLQRTTFGEHSRSRALEQLMVLVRRGLVTEAELAAFTGELQRIVQRPDRSSPQETESA